MNTNNSHNIIIAGLGKTGLSCVKYLSGLGFKNLTVVDNRESPPSLEELQQNFPNVKIHLGDFPIELLSQANEIILSPGISKKDPVITKIIQQGIPVIGDIELFARTVNKPVIAITGSNGKSTVTSLIGKMAQDAGKITKIGGNFGTPALDLLDPEADLYILELSSFQLETTYSLKPAAAVVLNICEDHMDRYININEYITAKQRIYNNCAVAVINTDDFLSYNNSNLPQNLINFGSQATCNIFSIIDNNLAYKNQKLLPIPNLKIKGSHNTANALAALALGKAINLPISTMVETLQEFTGLEHRGQWVANINNVDWYNDSKGTNVGATCAAIEGLGQNITGKIVVILGGLGKGADFTQLQSVIKKYVRTAILIGQDATIIKRDLDNACPTLNAHSMQEAVKLCASSVIPNDIVLLSPACASMDMFKNFEHRGTVFMEEVMGLKNEHKN